MLPLADLAQVERPAARMDVQFVADLYLIALYWA